MTLHNSVSFSTFTELCNQNHNLVLEQFPSPLKVPCTQPSFPPPSPATLICCLKCILKPPSGCFRLQIVLKPTYPVFSIYTSHDKVYELGTERD